MICSAHIFAGVLQVISVFDNHVEIIHYDNFIDTGEAFHLYCTEIPTNIAINPHGITLYGTGEVTVEWDPPTEREDGSPLLLEEIVGYKVYYGYSSGEYDEMMEVDSHTTSVILDGFPFDREVYISVVTIDINGIESNTSDEIIKEAQ